MEVYLIKILSKYSSDPGKLIDNRKLIIDNSSKQIATPCYSVNTIINHLI